MARNFSPTTDEISLGDIAAARFEFDVAWTVLAFFRVEETATDDRCIVSKWGAQFLWRIDKGTAPQNIEVYQDSALKITGASSIQLDTWYLGAVTNSGDTPTSTLTLYTFGMDGTPIDDGVTGTNTADRSLTPAIMLGRTAASSDPMDGDIGFACYVDAVLSKAEVLSYLYNPWQAQRNFQANYGTQFFLPLGFASPEPDFSPNGNTGTVSGTTIGEGPPAGPPFFDPGWQGAFVAGGGSPSFLPYPNPRYALTGGMQPMGGGLS